MFCHSFYFFIFNDIVISTDEVTLKGQSCPNWIEWIESESLANNLIKNYIVDLDFLESMFNIHF